jgi:hypothetical protein
MSGLSLPSIDRPRRIPAEAAGFSRALGRLATGGEGAPTTELAHHSGRTLSGLAHPAASLVPSGSSVLGADGTVPSRRLFRRGLRQGRSDSLDCKRRALLLGNRFPKLPKSRTIPPHNSTRKRDDSSRKCRFLTTSARKTVHIRFISCKSPAQGEQRPGSLRSQLGRV